MHVDLAAFEPSADGHKYYLVAAVRVEVDKESKLLPILMQNHPRTGRRWWRVQEPESQELVL